MRKIKFRAWHNTEERFVTIRKLDFNNGIVVHNSGIETSYDQSSDICKLTLQQFTGVTDSTGVEIYEGDIIKLAFRNLDIVKNVYKDSKNTLLPVILDKIVENEYTGEVKYDNAEGLLSQFTYYVGDICFSSLKSLVSENEITIIGNIFENGKKLN